MKERLDFTVAEFEKSPVIDFYHEGEFGTSWLITESVSYDPQRLRFGHLRLSQRLEDRKIEWANAICYDLQKGVQFFYDYNFNRDALHVAFGEDPYLPYKAVISLAAAEETPDGCISGPVNYGSFWYDKQGRLRTIRAGQLTYSDYQLNIPQVYFRETEQNGAWNVYVVDDIQKPTLIYFLHKKTITPHTQIRPDGQEIEIHELVYSLKGEGGIMRFAQRTITGHKQKIIEVPVLINISRWTELLGSTKGEWTKCFKEFPASISIRTGG